MDSSKRNAHIPDLLSGLKSSARRRDLQKGRRIHTDAVESGVDSNLYVAASLINMYAKCGSMADARAVFDSIQMPDAVSWNALILGYADNGQGIAALDLFSRMKHERRCVPTSLTYIAALKACTTLAAGGDKAAKSRCLQLAKQIHADIGCHMSQFVQSTLIDMYNKCGSMVDARTVFDRILEPDTVSWTSLILGYAENGQGLVAFDLFSRMKQESRCAPDSVTYIAVLKACASLAAGGDETGKKAWLEVGRTIHSEIACSNVDHFVQSTLIDMYANCGSMADARAVFDGIPRPNIVAWNALILGYAENGQGLAGLDLFVRIKVERKCVPDSVTYVAVVKACTSLAVDGDEAGREGLLQRGRQIHREIGCRMNQFVQSTLIDMYAKLGSMVEARTVFDSIQQPDLVSWNALIQGYADNGQGLVALDCFWRMRDELKCALNTVSYIAAIKACGSTGALVTGRKLHSEIRELDAPLVACLVDFYANCGSIEEARRVFDQNSRTRDAAAWNALLAGYSSFGDTVSVFTLFEAMQQDQGVQANAVTFVCVLSCCSHAGLVEKACEYLEAMPARHKVAPTVRHYTCVIDLLGRGNKMAEAVAVLRRMPCAADAVAWTTLLGACCRWNNCETGKLAFESLLELDPRNASAYVLMAELYASNQRVAETRLQKPSAGAAAAGQARLVDGFGRITRFVVGQQEQDPPGVQYKLTELLN